MRNVCHVNMSGQIQRISLVEIAQTIVINLSGGKSMKKITNKEYEEYQRYKKDRLYGRVFTPDSIRMICEACNNDPMSIGQYILENVCQSYSRMLFKPSKSSSDL